MRFRKLFLVFGIVCSVGCGPQGQQGTGGNQQGQLAPRQMEESRPAVLRGKPQGQDVYVAISEAAFRQYFKCVAECPAGIGLRQLVQLHDEGLIFNVDSGTKVIVINHQGSAISEVKISEGPHRGETGWVLTACVRD